MRILFLTSAHPGGSGCIGAGEGVGEGNLRALLEAGHEVHVLCLAPANQVANPAVVAACASYTHLRQTRWQALLGLLRNFWRGSWLAPWLFTRVSPKHVTAVVQELRRQQCSRVWIEFPSSLGFSEYLPDCELDYFVHDVVTQKIGRASFLKAIEPLVGHIESRLLTPFRCCHVISEKDADWLRKLGFTGSIAVKPPRSIKVGQVSDAQSIDRIIANFQGARNIVFFGNMKRAENHRSMMKFLLSSYRRIRRDCPSVQLWILGLGPRWSLRCLAWLLPGVHVTGPVDDPLPAFAAADLCIAPLLFGAGVKIKVLQMLEAGATVIATPVGAEGIAPSERLSVVDVREFPIAVARALEGEGGSTSHGE